MKILFLDFDGVLNNTGSFILGKYLREKLHQPLDVFANPCAESVHLLDRLLDGQDDVRIVVSSSWRKMPDIGRSVENLQTTLRELFGMRHWQRVIDFTPTLEGIRGDEIAAWLRDTKYKDLIERYVILDDDSDFLESQQMYLVRTTMDRGFGFPEYLEAKRILKINKKELVI